MISFKFAHKKCRIIINDTSGKERLRSIAFTYLKRIKIVIYLIDLASTIEGIDKQFIKAIKSRISTNTLIYLVGNKLDLVEGKNNKYRNNLIVCLEQAKLLIENKEIDYYFEVSAKIIKGLIF